LNEYEGMFLFDPTFAGEQANIDSALDHVMGRAGGVVMRSGKWDERKLAYEIDKRKRGCYVLVYFKAPPESIPGIERDCRLHNDILRVLIKCLDGLSEGKQTQLLSESPAGSRKVRESATRSERPPAPREAASKPTPAAAPAPADAPEATTAVLEKEVAGDDNKDAEAGDA